MSAQKESGTLQLKIRIGGEVSFVTVTVDDGDWSVQLEQHKGQSPRLEGDAYEFTVPTARHDSELGGSNQATIRASYISN